MMRWKFWTYLLSISIVFVVWMTKISHAASPRCTNTRLRKEIRDLSPDEWKAFTDAINTLKRVGRYDIYISTHAQYTGLAHNGDNFFAWHRRMIYDLETDILEITGKRLSGLPYFDPHMSYDMFNQTAPYYMGNPIGCITEGPFAGFLRLNGACVPRTYDGSVTAVDPRITASLIMSNVDFHTFSQIYELGQHAQVHTAVGGTMATLSESPSDPVFYIHHSHVDYIWYKRQWFNPDKLYWDMNGTHSGQPVNLGTTIPGPWGDVWGLGAQISDPYWVMCYDYEDPSPRASSKLVKRQVSSQAANTTTTPSENNGKPASSSTDTGTLGIFQPLSETHIAEIKPLTADQLANFNIDPTMHQKVVDHLNTIGQELNLKLQHGENVPSVRDIKKSDVIPDPQKGNVGGKNSAYKHFERVLGLSCALVAMSATVAFWFIV